MIKKSALAVPLMVAAALVLSACTGAADTGTDTATDEGGTSNEACIASVNEAVDKAREPLELTLPSEPIDFSKVEGKNIWIINILTNQMISDSNEGFTAAAEAAGVDLTIYDGQGTVSGWNEGIQQAIAQGADAIALYGIDRSLVSEAVKEAAEAGIIVTESLALNYDVERHEDLYTTFSADYYTDGATLANWTLADSDCTASTYLLYSTALPIWVDMQQGALDAYAENCPECDILDENVDPANVATEVPRVVQTRLTQAPETGYVLATWDSAAPFIESAASPINPEVAILGRDGIEAALDEIRTGGMMKVTVAAPPPQWIGWTVVDDLLRGIAGQEPNGLVIPTRLIDPTNVGETDADVMPNYVGFEDEYKKVWGL
ncbi:MAG TPA: substrate-binding domain-containing protein [Microbacteriaceae bacterium]|nr:substrate-binding domain-containing protein [Microbacteriaceae bacterium]